jgi:hypothetical protein
MEELEKFIITVYFDNCWVFNYLLYEVEYLFTKGFFYYAMKLKEYLENKYTGMYSELVNISLQTKLTTKDSRDSLENFIKRKILILSNKEILEKCDRYLQESIKKKHYVFNYRDQCKRLSTNPNQKIVHFTSSYAKVEFLAFYRVNIKSRIAGGVLRVVTDHIESFKQPDIRLNTWMYKSLIRC